MENENKTYLVNSDDLTSIANAIRTQTGESGQLVFPSGMASEISSKLVKPTGNKDITTTSPYDVKEFATAQISDVNLKAENIAKDVTVLGIKGTHEGGITPSGKIELKNLQETDVTTYATAQIVDSNLVAGNIAKDVTILGITGTYQGGITPTGTINITTNGTHDVTTYASANVQVDANDEGIPQFYIDSDYQLHVVSDNESLNSRFHIVGNDLYYKSNSGIDGNRFYIGSDNELHFKTIIGE